MSIGVVSSKMLAADTEMSMGKLAQGRCITARFRISPPAFEQSWNSLFIWMTEQGYKKAERNPFEIYHGAMGSSPDGTLDVELCIPIE